MRLHFSARTETGPIRPENQDAYHADPETGLFIVCDGMGGHNAGSLASSIAIEELTAFFQTARENRVPASDHKALVIAAISEANLAIKARAAGDRELMGMGTTCILTLVDEGGRVVMGHVGDSRLYLSRDTGIKQLSEDHSYVQELVKCGALRPEEVSTHPQRNIITRALGLADDLKIDTLEFSLEPGATLLLCSDGLSGYFHDDLPLQTAASDSDIDRGVNRLVDHALAAGGKDNITCILVRRISA